MASPCAHDFGTKRSSEQSIFGSILIKMDILLAKIPLEIRKVEKNWNENHIDIVPSFFWEISRKHTYLMVIFILPKFTKSDTDVVKFCFKSCGYQKHTYLMLIFQKVNDSRGKKSDKDRQRNWDCKIEFYTCFFQNFSSKT